jgi:type I restriction enzyme M protein
VQQNFPIRTGETAFLFLQHFIKRLKAGGRAAIVIKNTFLSNSDNASVSLRKLLLESCNLHTILDCPGGTFQGAGVKTVVLFFEKGAPTRKVWYYQLEPGAASAKPIRSMMRTWRSLSNCKKPLRIRARVGAWTRRRLTRRVLICR